MNRKPDNSSSWLDPELLLRPDAFPHETKSLKLLETHISWVVLTGKFAYKIKKPIQFSFIDYSTLELRKHFCELELELNQELAPDIYLDVVTITGPASNPVINGAGEVLEYAVRMNEFEQSDILTYRLENGLVTALEIDQLARLIAGFHARIPHSPPMTRFGTVDLVRQEAEDNFSVFRSGNNREPESVTAADLSLSQLQRNQLDQLRDWTLTEIKHCEQLLIRRHNNGMIRRCHGDMHANNIVRFNGRIEIFDRIEFNQDFQWTDCLNDLAFPFMDLIHLGRADFANRMLSVYLEETGDFEGLRVFRFYLVYRAMVRAKVDWIRHQQTLLVPHQSGIGFTTPFLDLAVTLSRRPPRFLHVTHGLSGSGKSTAAMNCVEATGAIRIRSDVERNRVSKNHSDVEKYSPETRSQVYGAMLKIAGGVLESGFPVVVDATFLNRIERDKFHELAKMAGVPFGIIECDIAVPVLERRIRERQGDASQATVEVLHDQILAQEPLTQEELECICNT